jgi:hypothetical protein
MKGRRRRKEGKEGKEKESRFRVQFQAAGKKRGRRNEGRRKEEGGRFKQTFVFLPFLGVLVSLLPTRLRTKSGLSSLKIVVQIKDERKLRSLSCTIRVSLEYSFVPPSSSCIPSLRPEPLLPSRL